MSARSWGLHIFLSVLWGGSFFFVAVAVTEVPPLTVVLLRVALAALALPAILRLADQRLAWRRSFLLPFFVMGLMNNAVPFSLLFWAQTMIESGLASILNATTPIFAIVVAHLTLADEQLKVNKLAGVILGFVGVAVLLSGDLVAGFDQATLGVIACLGAALSYGIAIVFARRFAKLGVAPGSIACGQLTASTLIMLPFVLLLDQPWTLPVPSFEVTAAIVLLAILSTALAYLLYFRILAQAGAVNAALVTLLVPVSAILLGTIILGERLAVHHFLGMGLIALGLLAIDGRLLRRH